MATDNRGHTVPASGGHPERLDVTRLSASINDVVYATDAADRASKAAFLAPTAVRPVVIRQQDTGQHWEYNGTTARVISVNAGWTPYTPTWGSTTGTQPTIGSGSAIYGGWTWLNGSTVAFRVRLDIASATFGSDSWFFSLPVASAAHQSVQGWLFLATIGFLGISGRILTGNADCRDFVDDRGINLSGAALALPTGTQLLINGTYEAQV